MPIQDIIFKTVNKTATRTKLIIIQAIKQNDYTAVQIADLFQLFATKVEKEKKAEIKADIIPKHLGSDTGWTKYENEEHKLVIGGGYVNQIEYLEYYKTDIQSIKNELDVDIKRLREKLKEKTTLKKDILTEIKSMNNEKPIHTNEK